MYGKIYREKEPSAWCECCERPLFFGDSVLRDNRFMSVRAYICMNCFCEAGKKELVELLGASFEDVDE